MYYGNTPPPFLWSEGPNIYIKGVIRFCSDNIARIFSCTMLCEASGRTLHRVFAVQCCPLGQHCIGFWVLRQHWTWFFPVHCFLEPKGKHCRGFLLVQCCIGFGLWNVVPRILKKHWTGFVPAHCCRKP